MPPGTGLGSAGCANQRLQWGRAAGAKLQRAIPSRASLRLGVDRGLYVSVCIPPSHARPQRTRRIFIIKDGHSSTSPFFCETTTECRCYSKSHVTVPFNRAFRSTPKILLIVVKYDKLAPVCETFVGLIPSLGHSKSQWRPPLNIRQTMTEIGTFLQPRWK